MGVDMYLVLLMRVPIKMGVVVVKQHPLGKGFWQMQKVGPGNI